MVRMRTPRPLNVAWPPPLADKEDEDPMKSTDFGASSSSSFHEAVSDIQEWRDDGGSSSEMREGNLGNDDERCVLISDNENSFEMELHKYSFQSEVDKRENHELIDSTGAADVVNNNASDIRIMDIVKKLENDSISGIGSLIEREDEEIVKDTGSVDSTKAAQPDDEFSQRPEEEGLSSNSKTVVDDHDESVKSESGGSVEADNVSDSQDRVQAESVETEVNPSEASTEKDAFAINKEQDASKESKIAAKEPESSSETKFSANEQDALMESRVKALIERKVAMEPKQAGNSQPAPAEIKGQAPIESKDALDLEMKGTEDDDIAGFDSFFSDDTDYAVIEDRPLVDGLKTAASSMRMSSIRANLLSKAKEMVDLYKIVIENDGFSGPEGEATRHFLTEMGSELKIKLGDGCDIANLKAQLLSKDNEILRLEGCVISTNEMMSELRTRNISLRTKIDLLEDELDTCQTREKYEIGRLEARLSSMELLHQSVYKERDELKKWKSEAEASLKSQSADLNQLISQNSTLLDLCNEKEEFIKDLSKWKNDAEDTIQEQDTKLDELSSQTSHLVDVCSKQQESIKELTKWKSDAEYAINTQSHDIKELRSQNSNLLCRCNEQQVLIGELTTWKADAKEKLKSNDEELMTLRSQNSTLLTQCNEQGASIEEQKEKIKTLSHKLEVESYTVSRFEEDFLVHSKSMMSLKESIQAKSSEIDELKARIVELNSLNDKMAEQAKAAPSRERENQEKEKLAMKMNHHKEILLLKTQKHDLASRVDDLLAEQAEFRARIEVLNENVVLLEKELQNERERHTEARMAVAGMEKALRVRNSNDYLIVHGELY